MSPGSSHVPSVARPLTGTDVPAAVELHLNVMSDQFLTRFGPRFLNTYYRAFLDDAAGLALVVPAPAGVRGVLLGAVEPAAHYRHMVRAHAAGLVGGLLVGALRDPQLGVELVRTRGTRYLRALVRMAASRRAGVNAEQPPAEEAAGRTAEVTVVAVDAASRRQGVGRALLCAAEMRAAESGAARIELVTPVDDAGAQQFYEQLGWQAAGTATSGSGEQFLRFVKPLAG